LARGKDNTTTAKEFREKERKKLNDEVEWWSWYVEVDAEISSKDYKGKVEKMGWWKEG
jgi:hypothetical protein